MLQVFGAKQGIDDRAPDGRHPARPATDIRPDPKSAIRLLVDMAIRSLPPATNDPPTATQALDQIGGLWVRIGLRRIEIGTYRDSHGRLRLVVPFPTWRDLLRLAFGDIRHYGADSGTLYPCCRKKASPLVFGASDLQGTATRPSPDADEQMDASVKTGEESVPHVGALQLPGHFRPSTRMAEKAAAIGGIMASGADGPRNSLTSSTPRVPGRRLYIVLVASPPVLI